MQRGMSKRLLAAVLLGLFAVVLGSFCLSEAAAPPRPSGRMTPEQLNKLTQLENRLRQALEEGEFGTAVEMAAEIASLREGWQGEGHWQSVDAREEVKRYRQLARLPQETQQELALSFRAKAKGDAHWRQNKYKAADEFYREALTIHRKVLGEEHPHTARCYNNVGGNLNAQGKHGEAQPLFQKALEIDRKVFGELHPSTANSYNNLAMSLNAQGKYGEAQPLFQKALEIHRKLLGEEHPSTANSYNNAAAALHAQSKYGEAQPLFQKALEICRKVLGEEHPSTANSYNNVAAVLQAQGKYGEAQPPYQKALEIYRKVLGEEHPATASSYNSVASNLNAQGKHGEAQPLYQKALEIRRKVLGKEHPSTAASYNNVASNLNAQGKYVEAQLPYQKALEIYRKVLGEEHPHTALSYNNVAINLDVQGKYGEAQPLYQKALEIRRKVLGELHPDTATSYNSVGSNQNDQGKYGEAQSLYQKALEIHRKVLGEEHPDTATSYNSVALNLGAQGKHAEARPLYQKALEIHRKVLGEEHPSTAQSYNNVAYNLDSQGKHVEAQPLFQKALEIRRKVLGELHPDTATSYNNVAYNLGTQGRFSEAQPLYQKALEIRCKVLSELHPDTATSYNNVAGNLDNQGKHGEAQPLYQKALEIYRKVLSELHPDTATSYNNVGYNLNIQGKHGEALPLLQRALEIRRKVLGELHPDTAQSYNSVALNLWKQKKIEQAVRLLQESLPGQEAARFHSNSSGFDRALASSENLSPRLLLALALARLEQPKEAFTHAEASLSRGLLDDRATPHSEDERRIASLNAELQSLDRQLLPLLGKLSLSEQEKARRQDLIELRRKNLAQVSLLASASSARQLLPLDDIQKQIPKNTALVLWLDINSLEEHQACIVRSQGEPIWVRLPGSGKDGSWTKEDSDLPTRLYRLLEQPVGRDGERQRLSKALAEQRLEPLRPHVGAANGLPVVRQLLVVPTGWVGVVPLEVLSSEYRVSYVPSGSVFARLKQKHRPVEGTSLLALGDPVFTTPTAPFPEPPEQGLLLTFVQPGGSAATAGLRAGDVLLKMGSTTLASIDDLKKSLGEDGKVRFWREGQQKTVELPAGPLGVRVDPRPAGKAVVAWREAEASPVKRGPAPVALPGTRWEVQTLARLVPGTIRLLGSEASEQRLDELAREKKLATFRLLHLATHGVVDWQTPARSRLLLARDRLPDPLKQAEAGLPVYTGELTVSAIRAKWKLDADLVVLSACRTGLGRDGGGEGLMGFAQAFLQAGAQSVVLSRWEADDSATALLMVRFYENVLGSKARKDLTKALPRAEALEEAKNWLRTLPRRDAELLVASLQGGKLSDTVSRGSVVELDVKERPKLPEGDRPYAHPYYWATFVLIGDPD